MLTTIVSAVPTNFAFSASNASHLNLASRKPIAASGARSFLIRAHGPLSGLAGS